MTAMAEEMTEQVAVVGHRQHEGGLASPNDLDHPAALKIFRDELVHAGGRGVVPAPGPVARATDDANNAIRIRTI